MSSIVSWNGYCILVGMAYLDQDEYIPVWLPHWLPDEILEEIYLGILAGSNRAPQTMPEEAEGADGYIIQDWFGPFLLSPRTSFMRGRC
jgi:hypothetical protein